MKCIRCNFATLIYVLLAISLCVFIKNANAFGCTSNGLSIGGNGTFTIPVDITLTKSSTDVLLTDLSAYTTCSGYLGWAGSGGPAANDALRTYGSSSFSSVLASNGFIGYAVLPTGRFNFPLPTGQCVWPDGRCTYDSSTTLTTKPIYIQIGMVRNAISTGVSTTIPAGTEIARFTLEQRGTVGGAPPTWGNGIKTWVFTLKNPLIIPSYTCQINNPNQTVVMPPVNLTDIKNNGAGRYPAMKGFNIALTCDPHTVVSMKFDGTSMQGHNDVLANSDTGNNAIGIQVMYNNAPVILGVNSRVISDAQAQETLAFNAAYYFNGDSALHAGPVSSVATVTFTYN